MKIVLGNEATFEDAKKIGKAVLVAKNGKNEFCAIAGELKIISEIKNLGIVLECLTDLGFDFAILEGFELEIEEIKDEVGFNIPKAEKIDDLQKAPEFETIKSIAEKLKKGLMDCGAVGIFVGVARGVSEGKKVEMLEYEAYKEILDDKVKELVKKVKKFPGIKNVEIYHKIGKIKPGEDIVYIGVIGQHRKDIWAPLILAVELMKTDLPIWKKERFENGEERWI
ncbi:MAG: molybdenum cofactor biosynthesis protein MoaE [Archaeoglobaceae archaeon]|nr:molybdenum cofactor biosynthesis protein MoaE [Archaeoglobaceae archaeon]MDW7989671.1 molybdenum cofactor biosynthesis protein MoaE [Archaeoglobaceae archaeon]